MAGCASVVDYEYDGERVAEERSVKVDRRFQKRGVSKKLNGYGKGLAMRLGYKELHALVNDEARKAFESSGFELVDYRPIPKIQRDCVRCPFYNNGCKESTFVAYLDRMK